MKRAARGTKKRAGGKRKAEFVHAREAGPHGWIGELREASYARLIPRELSEVETPGGPPPADGAPAAASSAPAPASPAAPVAEKPKASPILFQKPKASPILMKGKGPKKPGARARAHPAEKSGEYRSTFNPAAGEETLSAPSTTVWQRRLSEYHRRRHPTSRVPGIPTPPALARWTPLGPSSVMAGQAVGRPAMGGRVAGIAVAPGGKLAYAASANGGVFRSDDGGLSWRPLMDTFDQNPTNFACTSLACGAIAIDLKDPQRLYVGTGEGATYAIFSLRLTNALPAYRGIGAIRSDDGGATWVCEGTDPGSPPLSGEAFFGLAVDPANREHVVAATSRGLYQRSVQPGADPLWTLRRAGVHSSVLVATSGAGTRFFAAEWGKGIVESTDGTHWAPMGDGFPSANVGRITLAGQSDNADLAYALVSDQRGALLGLFRFDRAGARWREVKGPPKVLPPEGHQGDYDLAIAVDPKDAGRIYLGGSFYEDGMYWPASIWRTQVKAVAGGGWRATTSAAIGKRVHADVHALAHSPGDPDALWACCDGGVFFNAAPRTTDKFQSRNNGLACLCANFFAQDPEDPSTLLCGLQDNGTARSHSGSLWKHVNSGDGGYCLINWANPDLVLSFANGSVYRAEDGGQGNGSWDVHSFPWGLMTEPIVGTPYNPSRPSDANIVALGAAKTLYVSTDFGESWPTTPTLTVPGQGGIFALAFASAKRLFIGTSAGEVYRADKVSGGWKMVRLDDVAAGPLPLRGLVSDVAVDWADPDLASVYLVLGGMGDYRHVWHFDGKSWSSASGVQGGAGLLDVEHNALVVDRAAPSNLYVGADIGVWHSADRGKTWLPLSTGLPDAP
ncbi:MAG TPA: hypothetical protein VFB81_14565, partial [Myxococcales bacterium]|nr:hypothetical protein [Myxococcales bacterium]